MAHGLVEGAQIEAFAVAAARPHTGGARQGQRGVDIHVLLGVFGVPHHHDASAQRVEARPVFGGYPRREHEDPELGVAILPGDVELGLGLRGVVARLLFRLDHDAGARGAVLGAQFDHRVTDFAIPDEPRSRSGLREQIPRTLRPGFEVLEQRAFEVLSVGGALGLRVAFGAERRHLGGDALLERVDLFALLLGDVGELATHTRQRRGVRVEGELVGDLLLGALHPVDEP